jgi:hypothetical protein
MEATGAGPTLGRHPARTTLQRQRLTILPHVPGMETQLSVDLQSMGYRYATEGRFVEGQSGLDEEVILQWLKANGEDVGVASSYSGLARLLVRVADDADYKDIQDIVKHTMYPGESLPSYETLTIRLPVWTQLLRYGAAPLLWLAGLVFWRRRLF